MRFLISGVRRVLIPGEGVGGGNAGGYLSPGPLVEKCCFLTVNDANDGFPIGH